MMKLGLLSAILADMSYKEVIDYVAARGLGCVELAAWPKGDGARRYAGVSHVDAERLTPAQAEEMRAYATDRHVEISALGYYPQPAISKWWDCGNSDCSPLPSDRRCSDDGCADGYHFSGTWPVPDCGAESQSVAEVWPPIIEYAGDCGIRIGIENCPMLFTDDEWPGGQNIMTSPAVWQQVFDILDYDNFWSELWPIALRLADVGLSETHLWVSG